MDNTGKELVISDGHSKMLVPEEEGRSPNADIRFNAFSKAGEVTTVSWPKLPPTLNSCVAVSE